MATHTSDVTIVPRKPFMHHRTTVRFLAALSAIPISAVLLAPIAHGVTVTIPESSSWVSSGAVDDEGTVADSINVSLPEVGNVSVSTPGGTSSVTGYDLSHADLTITLDHARREHESAFAQSIVSISFSPDTDVSYDLSGSYGMSAPNGGRIHLSVQLRDELLSESLFDGLYESLFTADETFTLGSLDGEFASVVGSLTGVLTAGGLYQLNVAAWIEEWADEEPATATGSVTLAFVPEPGPGTLLMASLLALVGWRRVPGRGMGVRSGVLAREAKVARTVRRISKLGARTGLDPGDCHGFACVRRVLQHFFVGPLALVTGLIASPAFAVTIEVTGFHLNVRTYEYLSNTADGDGVHLSSPVSLPQSGSLAAEQGGYAASTDYALSSSGLTITFDHAVPGEAGHARTFGELYFTPTVNMFYELGGYYVASDPDGRTLAMEVALGDLGVDVLFHNWQVSKTTPNESFLIGGQGGDIDNELFGDLTGVLTAGVTYVLWFNFTFDDDNGSFDPLGPATATGTLQLAFVPEPSVMVLLVTATCFGLLLLLRRDT
jgi:hypothetical protein